jgi:hypothetical protein
MKAFRIDPAAKTITEIDLANATDALVAIITQKDIGFDEIDDNGDRLYFDEACFINEKPGAGRFQLDRLPPVSGVGVVAGWDLSGDVLRDAQVSHEKLTTRVKFI